MLTDKKNMDKCWERYGKKMLKPNIVQQDLMIFVRTQNTIESRSVKQYVVVLTPLVVISQHEGLPTLMEGSHRKNNLNSNKSYDTNIQPGHALMFDGRLKILMPPTGGGVMLARVYDLTGD